MLFGGLGMCGVFAKILFPDTFRHSQYGVTAREVREAIAGLAEMRFSQLLIESELCSGLMHVFFEFPFRPI